MPPTTAKQQRIRTRQIAELSAMDAITGSAPRTDAAARVFAAEWLVLNSQLTPAQEGEIKDEMAAVETVAERLMIVRNWAGRLATAAAKSKATTIFDLARQAVEARVNCFTDETVIIYQDHKFKVRIWRSSGRILMDAVNGDPKNTKRVQIGHLARGGWQFTLDQTSYRQWVKRVHRLI